MNTLLVALLSVVAIALHTHAGEKFSDFSGNITYLNDENRSLVVKNENNRELSFFVAGSVLRGNSEINMSELSKGCSVTITYQKNKRRYIANRVTLMGCQHAEH